MSANVSCDVSSIQDEDILRKMWQDTEDFGRKKEIRAHMYKVREARLKDLYSTGEVQTSIQKTTSKKSNVQTSHADSLADHSFLSLKSKEIRDSESPTRDVAYNKINTTEKYGGGNQGWTITSSDDTSKDGKTHTSTRTATTSGTEKLDKGVSSYAAKAEQKASVYQDGDENNFVKSVGNSDSSVIRQEASGGDANHSFRTSSSTSKSSSSVSTKQQSKSGDANLLTTNKDFNNQDFNNQDQSVGTKVCTSMPSDAKTVVYTETKTLPDGSKIITTRYETKGGTSKSATSSYSTSSQQVSSSSTEQKSSTQRSSMQSSNTAIEDNKYRTVKDGRNDRESIEYTRTEPTVKRTEDTTYIKSQDVQDRSINKKSVNVTENVTRNIVNEDICKSVYDSKSINDNRSTNKVTRIVDDVEVIRETPSSITTTEVTTTTTKYGDTPSSRKPIEVTIQPTRQVSEPVVKQPQRPRESTSPEKYKQPERQQPHKPAAGEIEVTTKATQGQYDTTYRSEFTNKKRISVEMSPQHDAFARSLRAITPEDRMHSTNNRSLRNSNTSLRSSASPEKMRHPSRVSPDRLYGQKRYTSPEKSPDRKTYNKTESVTRGRHYVDESTTTRRSSTLTRDTKKKEVTKSRSRSASPTTTVSDFEFVSGKQQLVTDLDDDTTTTVRTSSVTRTSTTNKYTDNIESRPSSLSITKKTKKITERSPTSPLSDFTTTKRTPSPIKEVLRRSSLKDELKQEKVLRRSDTYEERCRQILGIPEKKKPEKNISDIISVDRKTYVSRSTQRKPSLPDAAKRTSKSPEKKVVSEFPSQTRTSPDKSPTRKYPERQPSPSKEPSKISEFPAQIRKSPERKPQDKYPEKQSPVKEAPKICEFPSQIRKTPEREPLPKYSEKKSPVKDAPTVSEFPAQARRTPERESLGKYPEKQSPVKEGPKISEFPSQKRKTPEREALPEYPERQKPVKEAPKVSEFPSQIRKTPEKEPLPDYPEKQKPVKEAPKVSEFPSQIRKTPERELLPEYPEKSKPIKEAPKVSEFPSQVRKTPEREPLPKYPEKEKPIKEAPTVCEFPSQVRRKPEKEPLPEYPEKQKPTKDSPKVSEFPSQIRKTPEREPLPKYPEKEQPIKEAPTVCEFPSQVRRKPEKESLPEYPEKQKPTKDAPKVSEFPSQIRKTPEREPLPKYPDKEQPIKEAPTVCEFPSQVRRKPEKEPLPKYPEKQSPVKESPKVSEFPSQIRKTPEREPLPDYPEKQKPAKQAPKVSEFPAQARRTPEQETTVRKAVKQVDTTDDVVTKKKTTQITEFPTQKKKSPKKEIDDTVLEQTATYLYEKRIPVDEPLFTKKFIAELGSDDECEIVTDEVNTLESEIIREENTDVVHKTVKKDSPERYIVRERLSVEKDTIKDQINSFIDTERNDIYRTTNSRKSSPDLRKSPERGILKHTSQFDEKDTKRVIESVREVIDDVTAAQERTTSRKTVVDDTKTKRVEEKNVITKTTVKSKPKQEKPTSNIKVNCITTKKHTIKQQSDLKIDKDTGEIKPKTTITVKSTPVTRRTDSPTKYTSKVTDVKINTSVKNVTDITKAKKTFSTTKEQQVVVAPKQRHVVTTTINVTPKTPKTTKPVTNSLRCNKNITNTQTVTKPNTSPVVPAKTIIKPTIKLTTTTNKKQYIEDIENIEKVATQRKRIDKIVRTTSEHLVKSKSPSKTPVRTLPKHELVPDSKKCITTKTILINNTVADQREIIVDLLRSTSTRDDANEVCPIPSKGDKSVPRYPDQIVEPDELSTKIIPRKVSRIPIDECESDTEITNELTTTEITVENVEKVDESLLSVNEKVSKFLGTADKLRQKPDATLGPAPKVDRPIMIIDEKLESDQCLLSVSEKVNKFITTAEKLSVHEMPDRPKSPRCQNIVDITDLDDETEETSVSVSDKVTHFVTTAENGMKPRVSTIKIEKPDLTNIDESIRTDDCLLSVSDKVSKFITTAEKLTTKDGGKKPAEFPSSKRPSRTSVDLTEDCVTIETEDQMYTRKSPEKQTTPKNTDRSSPGRRTSIKEERRYSRKDSSTTVTTDLDVTPKTSRRSSAVDSKPVLSDTGRLRSTEQIRKAKNLFESIATEQEQQRQKDILSRPSVFEGRKTVKVTNKDDRDVKLKDIGIEEKNRISNNNYEIRRKLSFPSDDDKISTTRTYLETTEDVVRDKSRSRSPDNLDVPGYMKPLDRALRPNSPHKSGVAEIEEIEHKITNVVQPDVAAPANKFGVTLRRTDSGRETTTAITTKVEERRRSSSVLKNIEVEIEEIYELDVLEQLLETTVGYDLRRRIRSQIRLVKNLLAEDKLKIVTIKTGKSVVEAPKPTTVPTKKASPERNFTEYQTKYLRKASGDNKSVDNKLYRHTDLISNKDTTDRSTEYQSSYSFDTRKSSTTTSTNKSFTTTVDRGNTESKPNTRRKSPEKSTRESTPEVKPISRAKTPDKQQRKTPERKTTSSTKVYQHAELKRVDSKSKNIVDDRPEWTKRTLRKIADTPAPVVKKFTATARSTTTKEVKSSSVVKDSKPTDVITSSYGVGPMDENGSPLFGLRALRAQNKMEQSKVQGTVVRSQFYSENGEQPIGEISVTKYSTDPTDLSSDEEITKTDGLISKTTTQKFGYKGTPSYQSVTENKKQFSAIEDKTRTKKTTKTTRRGSVKEMSQKFLENTVESLKNERQSTYPKAGLILRTSSFKDNSESSRECSPELAEVSTVTTVRTVNSKSSVGGQQKGETFLSNKSKVTGMQDVISRMQYSNQEEDREGETTEDTEARSLLNKFLGSQVILAGMEGSSTKATSSSASSVRRATTKITTTKNEGGKSKNIVRTFTHPITAEELSTVWDEETLRLLLEQSSEYDERRIIRARLKEVMAEKEVCAELLETTAQETSNTQSSGGGGLIQEKIETTKKSFTEGPITTSQVSTTKVTSQQITKKAISPFAKFRQLDKQNSLNTPPSTPKTPTSGGPLFKFTDPALSRSASTIKERLLQWAQMKTKEYENIKLDNFSGSWADGMAFCALVHHFLPDAFDYSVLTPNNRRHNFTLAFQIADEKADIAPLLDVEDMVATRRPDWKCVFTYVQSIYRRFKDVD